MVQSLKFEFDIDLSTPQIGRGQPWVMFVCQKEMELLCINGTKF